MGIQKLIGAGYDRDAKGNMILKTKLVDRPALCKECGKEPRMNCSSRCKKCSGNYKLALLDKNRLQRKVEAQAKN